MKRKLKITTLVLCGLIGLFCAVVFVLCIGCWLHFKQWNTLLFFCTFLSAVDALCSVRCLVIHRALFKEQEYEDEIC